MFFDNINKIEEIAKKTGAVIFVLPRDKKLILKFAQVLEPEDKSVITISQVRDLISRLNVKQVSDRFIVIRPAELMTEEAANAFLKNLEEPKERVHFILVTDSPSKLLSTILSRAEIYFLRENQKDLMDIKADERIKELAKSLLVAKADELIALAEEIAKKRERVREFALEVLGVAIEMLYKSYFITGRMNFLKRLPSFLAAYEAIEKNGHIKLQIIANLC